MAGDGQRSAGGLLGRLAAVQPGEWGLVLLAAAYYFCALASWYVVRPIRDELGIAGGVDRLAWLFTGTLAVTLALQPLFAALVRRWPRPVFVPWAYRAFGLQLVLFFALLRTSEGAQLVWVGRVFFVWASAFTLFVVSVFWSFMADVFEEERGRRLFGLVAVGGTLGAILGGALTAGLVRALGSATLLLVAAALLEVAAQCARRLGRRAAAGSAAQARVERAPLGGTLTAGVSHVLGSPYLLGIAAFMLLYTIGSTFLYFLQADIVAATFADRAARTRYFAGVDVAVNSLTLVLQLGVTGRLLTRLGVAATLALLPALSAVGFAALGLAPTLGVLVAFQIARRAGNFAIARPAREVLFIPLAREDKYKAKNFLDTFVYRLGDQLGAWSEAALRALGLAAAGIAAAAVPLAALWLALAVWLGRRHARLAAAPSPSVVIP